MILWFYKKINTATFSSQLYFSYISNEQGKHYLLLLKNRCIDLTLEKDSKFWILSRQGKRLPVICPR